MLNPGRQIEVDQCDLVQRDLVQRDLRIAIEGDLHQRSSRCDQDRRAGAAPLLWVLVQALGRVLAAVGAIAATEPIAAVAAHNAATERARPAASGAAAKQATGAILASGPHQKDSIPHPVKKMIAMLQPSFTAPLVPRYDVQLLALPIGVLIPEREFRSLPTIGDTCWWR